MIKNKTHRSYLLNRLFRPANRRDFRLVYFCFGEMTHLRYFMPLIKELRSRGIFSCFLFYFSGKYNCPSKHKKELDNLCKDYDVEKIPIEQFKDQNQIIFCVEKTCEIAIKQKGVPVNNNFYVLTYQFDYVMNYDIYEKYAKNIIFPSKWFLEHCESFIGDKRIEPTKWSLEKIKSKKNVFLGSPKYDVSLNKEKILRKYKLSKKKKVLFLFPAIAQALTSVCSAGGMWTTNEPRGLTLKQINEIYEVLRRNGFEVLVKSRIKHPISAGCEGDRHFYDDSWFPYTSMELMQVSDLVIAVDSTAAKECAIQKVPFINISLKNEEVCTSTENLFSPLFKFNFFKNYKGFPGASELEKSVKYLTNNNFSQDFQRAINSYLFEAGESSKNIIDLITSEIDTGKQ